MITINAYDDNSDNGDRRLHGQFEMMRNGMIDSQASELNKAYNFIFSLFLAE